MKNFSTALVTTAPSPATSGTTLSVASGEGARFTVGKASLRPGTGVSDPTNSEVVNITAIAAGGGPGGSDLITMQRAQESSAARTASVGDRLVQGVTAGMWDGLSGTYVPQDLGGRVILVGESHAAGNSDWTIHSRGDRDVLGYACSAAPNLFYAGNYGVASTSTATMLSTLPAALTAAAPDWVVLLAGTYDANPVGAVDLATYQANIRTFVTIVRATGARPVIGTVIPTATTGAYQQNVEIRNLWLRRWCRENGVDLLDSYSLVTDPATGAIKSAYSLDAVHLNAAGNKVVGDALGALIGPRSRGGFPPLAVHQATDSKNLAGNGLFLTDSNTDGLADGWSKSGAATASLVTGDAAIIGSWQRIADTDGTTISLARNSLTGWSVGDTLGIGCRLTNVVGAGGSKSCTVQLNFVGGTPNAVKLMSNYALDLTNFVVYDEVVIPAGTTQINAGVIRNSGTQGAGGYTQVAQFTVRNLTTEAVL